MENLLINDGLTVYPKECKAWVGLNMQTFEKLVKHVYANADNNDSYRNCILLCRYFERYSLMEFFTLRHDFIRLHNEAMRTPSATMHQNPEIGKKWHMFEMKFHRYENLLFSFIALTIGTDLEKQLEEAYQA